MAEMVLTISLESDEKYFSTICEPSTIEWWVLIQEITQERDNKVNRYYQERMLSRETSQEDWQSIVGGSVSLDNTDISIGQR